MLETLAPIVVALTAAALVIAGTRTPDNRRSHSNRTASLRRVRRALREKPESRRFVAVRNSWDRVDLARAIGTDNAAPDFSASPAARVESR